MKRRNLTLAVLLLSGVAMPAFAAWDRIGSVDFSPRDTRDTQYGNFGGGVEALAFQARDADVMCRNVRATFRNGQVRDVYHGTLQRGRLVTIDLPGRERNISRLDFDCRPDVRRGPDGRGPDGRGPYGRGPDGRRSATVDISADVGRYQAEWRRSPDWDRTWSRMFHWDNRDGGYVTGQLDTSGWITLGSEKFDGRSDRETTFTGWRGRNVDAIAFRPINDDARCRTVTATFQNGETRSLNIDGDMLRRDRITTVDLPGNKRDVTRIDLNCHAEHGGSVTIQLLASK